MVPEQGDKPKRRVIREIRDIPFSSNGIRLSGKQWIVAGLVSVVVLALLPGAWRRLEPFDSPSDYRIPFELGFDYWLYDRFCGSFENDEVIPVIGDSVVWGHYVTSTQTLSHCLGSGDPDHHYVNAGIDGSRPVALTGLIRHYGKRIRNKKVILQCNPLWMTNKKRDLQTKKEEPFAHSDLAPQFSQKIPCYRKDFKDRFGIVIKREIALFSWVNHLRMAYFDSQDIYTWSVSNPYACPYMAIKHPLPSHREVPPDTVAIPWTKSEKYGMQNPPWVKLETSLQWAAFKRAVKILESRGNDVFVLVGPYNRHMLREASAGIYDKLLADMKTELDEAGMAYFVPDVLPSGLYADSSHPLADGYAAIAAKLLEQPVFNTFLNSPKKSAEH